MQIFQSYRFFWCAKSERSQSNLVAICFVEIPKEVARMVASDDTYMVKRLLTIGIVGLIRASEFVRAIEMDGTINSKFVFPFV